MVLAHQLAVGLLDLVVAGMRDRPSTAYASPALDGSRAVAENLARSCSKAVPSKPKTATRRRKSVSAGVISPSAGELEQADQQLSEQDQVTAEQRRDLPGVGSNPCAEVLASLKMRATSPTSASSIRKMRLNALISSRVTRPSTLASLAPSTITAVANAIRRVSAGSLNTSPSRGS